MIIGLGNDLVDIRRIEKSLEQFGERFIAKVFTEAERATAERRVGQARSGAYAKRFAAKEALGKAFGTGIRAPLLLPEIAVSHDELGKPAFVFGTALAGHFAGRGLVAHLSISDEQDYAVAFVILEKP